MKTNFVLALFISATIFSSCSKGGGGAPDIEPSVTPVGTNDGTAVTKTIGSAGGGITSTDGQIELIIPAGALAANTDITVQPITNNAPNGRGKAYRCTPDGLQFAKDITIKLHYDEEEAALTKPEYMQAAYQTIDGTWKLIENITNDVATKTVMAKVNHFTDFSGFDVMRLLPASLYLKPSASGNLEISYAGLTPDNFLSFAIALLQQPAVWKVNDVTNGNSTHGTIQATAPVKATYTAPASAPVINPAMISVEINMPFIVNGQRFNKGILTGNAYIIGGKYSVLIESAFDLTIGTSEKFRIKDQVSFIVNLVGTTVTITNIQNSVATIQKIANSPVQCNTEVTSSGTGGIHLLDGDITGFVNPLDHEVYLSFNQTGAITHPKATTTCTGNTPGNIELIAANSTGGGLDFLDNSQQQVKNETSTIHTLKYTIIPLP